MSILEEALDNARKALKEFFDEEQPNDNLFDMGEHVGYPDKPRLRADIPDHLNTDKVDCFNVSQYVGTIGSSTRTDRLEAYRKYFGDPIETTESIIVGSSMNEPITFMCKHTRTLCNTCTCDDCKLKKYHRQC